MCVIARTAEYPRPDHFLLHISDTHLLAGGGALYGSVESERYLRELFADLEASGGRPEAVVFTGDLADKGEADAYARLRAIVEPAAARLGARIIWVMGNHDAREAFLQLLFTECRAAGASLLFVSHDQSLAPLFDRSLSLAELNRASKPVEV